MVLAVDLSGADLIQRLITTGTAISLFVTYRSAFLIFFASFFCFSPSRDFGTLTLSSRYFNDV